MLNNSCCFAAFGCRSSKKSQVTSVDYLDGHKMTMTNCTTDATPKNYTQELSPGIRDELIVLSVVNILLSFSIILGNSLIQVALNKVSSLHLPSKLLFRSLAITDLCVGMIAQPFFVAHLIATVKEQCQLLHYTKKVYHATGYCFIGVSVLIITAISVDRLLALLCRIRYPQVVTVKRVCVLVSFSWILGSAFSTVHIWNSDMSLKVFYAVIVLSAVISLFSYTKTFLTLRRKNRVQAQCQINTRQPQVCKRKPLWLLRYRKSVFRVFWVQLALIVCYLPYLIVIGLREASSVPSPPNEVVYFSSLTFVFLNSLLNPIVYCWKIKEVRKEVRNIMNKIAFARSI